MQLFITTDFKIKNNQIEVYEERILKQMRKVLRAKPWYSFQIQKLEYPQTKQYTRYTCKVLEIKNFIKAEIINTQTNNYQTNWKWIICWILNKFDKMELIVQKLTEIWLEKIYFTPFRRSQFKNIPDKKLERFFKISLEAAEQSFSRFLPQIKVFDNINQIVWKKAILNFDWTFYKDLKFESDFLVIWPEGWFDEEDIKQIDPLQKIKLWDKILRAETASIVWWFLISTYF